jgi:hypothetical protein
MHRCLVKVVAEDLTLPSSFVVFTFGLVAIAVSGYVGVFAGTLSCQMSGTAAVIGLEPSWWWLSLIVHVSIIFIFMGFLVFLV